MSVKHFFKNIKIDRYYKIISPAGVIFFITGIGINNLKITNFGILTFIYGLWAWMIGTGFHFSGNVKLKNPRHFAYFIIFIIVLSFMIYIFLTYQILT